MSEIFDESLRFDQLGLKPDVLKGVTEAGFVHPTNIQKDLIPAALAGRDVIGQAKTGTGKTAAFGLPILHLADPSIPMQALILVPTRELAVQVAAELAELGKHTTIKSVCIIGGESMRHQIKSVQGGAHIMVGTPGRVMDMQSRGEIHFNNVRFAVLDEVDRMLDIGFRDDIRKTLKLVRSDHQTIFVSATISDEIERLARSFMQPDAVKIVSHSGSLTVSLVDQKHLPVEPWDKKTLLLHLLRHEQPGTTLVFCRTKATVHRVTQYLRDKGISVREIHGDLPQSKRNKVIESLRSGNLDVLIASDLAARGLDIEHISHVINYDLPEDPEVYVHRIGRTARAGRRGTAWSFVTSEQGQLLTEIEKLTGTLIEKMEYPDFTPGPVPSDIAERRSKDQSRRAKPQAQKLKERQAAPTSAAGEYTKEELARMFPDGKIPSSLPRKTLGSRLRSRRR
ncbi:MAG: DEAD/DEAH box helicase [Phycisphaera sp.]|nr:DEAD/DEAH box helicase [Phycisphaera sp.]